jgi:CheY-like chemotaxis protein
MPEPYQSGVVLISEDPFVANYLRALLSKRGYQTLGVDAEQGARKIRDREVNVVITNTPGEFQGLSDQIPVVYVAAAPDMEIASKFRACRVLRKPFLPEDILAAVEELIHPLVA